MRLSPRYTVRLAMLTLLACGDGDQDSGGSDVTLERGHKIYQNVCIACHSRDPSQDGSLGPAVARASLELLQAKVLRGEYPAGYTPKRPGSSVMPRFEYLAEALPDLATYLAQVQPEG